MVSPSMWNVFETSSALTRTSPSPGRSAAASGTGLTTRGRVGAISQK